MAMPPSTQARHIDPPPAQLGAPLSPTLFNLNQHYNMSANSLTEALLLLSGVYISLVSPDPKPVSVGLHAILPKTAMSQPFTPLDRRYPVIGSAFEITTGSTRSDYSPREILNMLCNDVFPKNTISILFLNNHNLFQKYHPPAIHYLRRIIESLGLPIISYDTEFSLNTRPSLSVQLAPTMGQMVDVLFAFLRKFNWTDFSFLCTLSVGCEDEIASIRLKVDDSNRKPNVTVYGVDIFSFRLLSYVNFTKDITRDEIRDKLRYEMDKDTRIILFHGEGAEVKTIMDVAREMGMTYTDYVWIFTFTAMSSAAVERGRIHKSYPIGSFVIGYEATFEQMKMDIDTAIGLWRNALTALSQSPEFNDIDFESHLTCDRAKEDLALLQNGTGSPLFWQHGEKIYKYLLKSKLPGDLEFDEYGVLKSNKFWIKNVQYQESGEEVSTSASSQARNRESSFSRNRESGLSPSQSRFPGSLTRETVTRAPFSRGFGSQQYPYRSSFGGNSESDQTRTSNRTSGSASFYSHSTSSSVGDGNVDNRNEDTNEPLSSSRDFGRSGGQNESPSDMPSATRRTGISVADRIRHLDRDKLARRRGHRHEMVDSAHDDVQIKALEQNATFVSYGEKSRRRRKRQTHGWQIVKKIADWNGHNLSISGIVWPGGVSNPPKGKPEKYILKVVTWAEDPHVIYSDLKNETVASGSGCETNALPCRIYVRDKSLQRQGNATKDVCCAGLSIDLLKRLSEKLNFEVDLFEVADGSYGSPINKNETDWNGMLGMLIHGQADMAMGALAITPERSQVVDFSVPFLQTGITIIVAIREGAISPTAFLEPYDYPSWSLILVFSVHATGASIFIFEWLSPYGLDQGKTPLSVHKFSLFRSFWLIWAMLFGASVSTDQPRGCASRFLANIWALFAVVFCASYTANLAAFMITKDDYYDLSGIQDWRLKNPHHRQPPFKFATIGNSSTDLNIAKNYQQIHSYMSKHAQTNVKDAIHALKRQEIQAFIYDSTTLEYEFGKDVGCRLKTVGKRIAETGYGVAFPHRSQWVRPVDEALLRLQEDGEIERLQKFWLAGACHKKKERGVSSHTLGILNFTSAFILLGGGVILGVLLMIIEHIYFRFGRKSLKRWDKCGCCSLVSLSMGQSLTFEQSVIEAIDYHKHHKCKDPLCETQLWKVKHELDIALLKISQLRRLIAHSASLEAARGQDTPIKQQLGDTPQQNGNASRRRRRQQAADRDTAGPDKASAQPLLALEGKGDTDDDEDAILRSPKREIAPPPSTTRASFPSSKNKSPKNDRDIPLQKIRYSYPDKRTPDNEGDKAADWSRKDQFDYPQPGAGDPDQSKKTVADLEFHPPPPSFDEAMSGYSLTPEGDVSTPSPPLPPPPSSPLAVAEDSYSELQDSNASNTPPSSDDKRYEPFILDSPESPSSSTFSELSGGDRIPSPGDLSKLSDEERSTPVSPSRGSNFTSSPDTKRSLGNSGVPAVGFRGGPSSQTAPQPKFPQSSKANEPLPRPGGAVKPGIPKLPSKEDDNDVNTRRVASSEGNVYVNVDDIIGKETSF
ncbi:unnamed protein product [Lymnaea stagnalis]|uniref:Glutamate receptor ionotropic, NMDA 2B n=1 Tax=Lymnaea stagnalis TaxID=6523 RepID=A0AAV2GY91_LYMST